MFVGRLDEIPQRISLVIDNYTDLHPAWKPVIVSITVRAIING